MGFEPQIRRIVRAMPPTASRQTLLFSATFPHAIQTLAREFLRPHVWIGVGRVGSTNEGIEQRVLLATADKRLKLSLVVAALGEREGRTLVFVEKKRTATWLKKMLRNGGASDAPPAERFAPVAAEDIHGDRSQSQREAALAAFRSGACRVLVATDVAARGLDVAGVEHVINMDLPTSADDFDSYVHRIGRTGRAGHTGLATSLFVPGFDPKTGNGKIAPALATLLKEAKQVVPPFLAGSGGGHAKEKASTDVRRPNAPERVVAPPVPAAGAAPPHRDGGAGDKRRAPDGNLYTKAEFHAFFGGYTEWDAAADGAGAAGGDADAGGRGARGGGGRGRGAGRGRGLPPGRR
jgi:ATP-dependent RNA helicase DDX3X